MHFCTYEADVSNRAISWLPLLPYTEMNVWFTVDRGQLVMTMLDYRSALKEPKISPVVHVQQDICSRGCGVRFDVNPHGRDKQMWNGLVEFNPRATEAEKEAALALDLTCFYRVGGCKSISELLPTIWERTGTKTVTARMVGLSQRLEETPGFMSPDD